MQDKANTPAEISETQLDDISGGPHFRNFHRGSFDFQAMPELDANNTASIGMGLGSDLNLGNYTGSAEV